MTVNGRVDVSVIPALRLPAYPGLTSHTRLSRRRIIAGTIAQGWLQAEPWEYVRGRSGGGRQKQPRRVWRQRNSPRLDAPPHRRPATDVALPSSPVCGPCDRRTPRFARRRLPLPVGSPASSGLLGTVRTLYTNTPAVSSPCSRSRCGRTGIGWSAAPSCAVLRRQSPGKAPGSPEHSAPRTGMRPGRPAARSHLGRLRQR